MANITGKRKSVEIWSLGLMLPDIPSDREGIGYLVCVLEEENRGRTYLFTSAENHCAIVH
jgi:hypothetical protein